VIPVHDWGRLGKMPFDQVPDPGRPITDEDHFLGGVGLVAAGSRPKERIQILSRLYVAVGMDVLGLQIVLLLHPTGMVAAFLVGLDRLDPLSRRTFLAVAQVL